VASALIVRLGFGGGGGLIFTSFVGWWTGFWGFWRFYIFAFGLDWGFFSLSKEWKNVKVCFGLFWEEYPSLDPFFWVAKIRFLEWKNVSWSRSFSWRSFKKGDADREAKRNRCVARRCWAGTNRWFQLSSSMNNFWWQIFDEMGLWPEVLQEVVGLVASPFHPPIHPPVTPSLGFVLLHNCIPHRCMVPRSSLRQKN
jgi:hypothetical protein